MAEQMNWKATEERARRMSVEALQYAVRDCFEAAKAMGEGERVGKDASYYRDEMSVYHSELMRRQAKAEARRQKKLDEIVRRGEPA